MRAVLLGLVTLACGWSVLPGPTGGKRDEGGAGAAGEAGEGGAAGSGGEVSSGAQVGAAGELVDAGSAGERTGDASAGEAGEPSTPSGGAGGTVPGEGGAPSEGGAASSGAGAGGPVDECPEIEACETPCSAAIGAHCALCDVGNYSCEGKTGFFASDGAEFPCETDPVTDCSDAGAAALMHCCSNG
jgi:hypothetical protein